MTTVKMDRATEIPTASFRLPQKSMFVPGLMNSMNRWVAITRS